VTQLSSSLLAAKSAAPLPGLPGRRSPFVRWLQASARRHPSTVALLSSRGEWRYNELALVAEGGGRFLQAQGLTAGDGVAIAAGASELALAAMACAAAKVALLPLDPLLAEAAWPRLQALAGGRLQRLSPLPDSAYLARAACAPLAAERQRANVTELADALSDAKPADAAATDLALLIATSGSEGAPKVVMLSEANVDAAAAAANERLPLHLGDVWLACLPLHHIAGIAILGRCLRAAATLLLHEGFSAAAVWEDLHARRVTHLSLVPAMLARLLDAAQGAPPPSSLRHALIGGAALSRPLFERALASGWPIRPSWGMSESTAQAATLPRPDGDWQVGEVGHLLSGLQARVAADGRLYLRGAQVMAGYLNPAWRHGDGLEDGWLPTGDLGRVDAHGRLTILGRVDDILISGGVNVHPIEVESCLAACPGVADVAVTAVVDPVWGDLLVALVVGPAALGALHDWSRQHLVAAKRPRRVLRLETLPRNAIGKLDRRGLRVLAQAGACAHECVNA
jgi:O-succinylbenzoic acid--CoA ligase